MGHGRRKRCLKCLNPENDDFAQADHAIVAMSTMDAGRLRYDGVPQERLRLMQELPHMVATKAFVLFDGPDAEWQQTGGQTIPALFGLVFDYSPDDGSPGVRSTGILGRRAALFPPFLIPSRVPCGFTPRSEWSLRKIVNHCGIHSVICTSFAACKKHDRWHVKKTLRITEWMPQWIHYLSK